MSKITHEKTGERKQNIITKQIALSSDIYSVRLIPISADETNIKEIQDFIDKQQKLLELYREALKTNTTLTYYKSFTTNKEKIKEYESKVFIIKEQIKELENDNYNK